MTPLFILFALSAIFLILGAFDESKYVRGAFWLVSLTFMIIATITFGYVALVYQQSSYSIPSSGVIPQASSPDVILNVYEDITRTKVVTEVIWGEVEVGTNITKTLYVSNEGTVPFWAQISMANFSQPEVEQYLNVTWDFGDLALSSLRVRQIQLTLNVDENTVDIDTFNFNIIIDARDEPF